MLDLGQRWCSTREGGALYGHAADKMYFCLQPLVFLYFWVYMYLYKCFNQLWLLYFISEATADSVHLYGDIPLIAHISCTFPGAPPLLMKMKLIVMEMVMIMIARQQLRKHKKMVFLGIFPKPLDSPIRIWICVRTCYFGKQNSTLGPVVPLAMFAHGITIAF